VPGFIARFREGELAFAVRRIRLVA
jgi:hypothetical protein